MGGVPENGYNSVNRHESGYGEQRSRAQLRPCLTFSEWRAAIDANGLNIYSPFFALLPKRDFKSECLVDLRSSGSA